MRTSLEIERRLFETEAAAANAVAEMDRQLSEAKRLLASVVLAAGGHVRVGMMDLARGREANMTIEDDPQFGGVRVVVRG